MARPSSTVFDFRVFGGTRDEALARIFDCAAEKSFHHVMFATGLRLLRGRLSKRYRALYTYAHLILPEGRSVRWAAKVFKHPVAESFSPVEFLMDIIRDAIRGKQTIFFLGSDPEVLSSAIDKLRVSFPEIRIVGSHHGYFSRDRGQDIVQAIRKFSPDYLFVGMGFPFQDFWIEEHREAFPHTTCISVGHAFDLCAGVRQRGPRWMRRAGLEGLYKAGANPLRVGRLFKLVVFVFLVWWDRLFRMKGK